MGSVGAEIILFAQCSHYQQLIEAICARLVQLHMAAETVDELAGEPQRYLSKIISPMATKRLSLDSMFAYIGALGLRLALVTDEAQLARIRHSSAYRERKRAPAVKSTAIAVHIKFSRRHMQKIGAKGGAARKFHPRKRKLAQLAALARWSRAARNVSVSLPAISGADKPRA